MERPTRRHQLVHRTSRPHYALDQTFWDQIFVIALNLSIAYGYD